MDTKTDSVRQAQTLLLLREGTGRVEGLFPLGSNATFLCQMESSRGSLRAVYKPARGERPLWDFPAGSLGRREAAAFEVSRGLHWDFVPPTVFREDGPLGPGSFQEFIDLDPEANYFTLREGEADALRQVAAFDMLINNADRKAMHVLRDTSGRIRLIDHGVCFHTEPKLRTVIWEFAGERIPAAILTTIRTFRQTLMSVGRIRAALENLLSEEELEAMAARAVALESSACFPEPGPGWNVPWPIWA
jgi:hypothetical protein